ncbi:MAG: response regulator transcription factor, partial [Deltaproteobacteria bacterium]|nr:response regulator transcription factor [Deltaproteobacteria bacterium]
MHARHPQRDRILLVDSDPADIEALRTSFEDLRFETYEVGTIHDALLHIAKNPPSLVLSELALPDGSGFALCRAIRSSDSRPNLPVVLISRWSTEGDRILAFECGADDVIAKPFSSRELSSRVRAVLRRATNSKSAESRQPAAGDGGLEIRPNTREVQVGLRRVALTPKEFAILEALLQYRGRVLTRDALIGRVWTDETPPGERSVDAHV